MYFFYIDESGTKDPEVSATKADGTVVTKEHLYVLTAVSLFQFNWRKFEREITNVKLELSDHLFRRNGTRFDLSQCETKSTWLRLPGLRAKESPFLHALCDKDRTRLGETFYAQLESMRMHLFSVVVDKRKLHGYVDHDILFKRISSNSRGRVGWTTEQKSPLPEERAIRNEVRLGEPYQADMQHPTKSSEGSAEQLFSPRPGQGSPALNARSFVKTCSSSTAFGSHASTFTVFMVARFRPIVQLAACTLLVSATAADFSSTCP
ncbi:MAG: hypothetical protein KA191_16115 [Verrucomicrobia bacterium]|jgi:hypothetical protein|nr:hypothetical protein [Verrucomicrobiota bacterium]OQC63277.1 MAG: hypothetical protein BWX48_03312 [Verrucomicrobia bacterium ADurb.Bin006]MDI9379336.1 hypothetical protein [Verrucomicrobiota bacterium]NMD22100.1 DUF3800 domain-containing protein [Verrucomicrobiota bacterium]HOA62091.1 hypothetical protein [Verrucomicrobiota bacterium]